MRLAFKLYIGSILLLMLAITITHILGWRLGNETVAWELGYPGLGLLMLGWFLIAGIDSRKRWPDKSFMVRLGKIISFQR